MKRFSPRLILLAGAAVIAMGVIGSAFAYTALHSAPARLALPSSSATSRPAATPNAADPIAAACGTPAKGNSTAGLSGLWLVQPGGVAGYRAHETWAGVSTPNDAVARTPGVRGWALLTEAGGITLDRACFAVELMTLTSQDQVGGQNMNDRDENVHDFLHARTHPYAIFRASGVALIGQRPTGSRGHVRVNGSMEISGISRPASLSVDVALNQEQLNLVGSTVVVSTDYGLELPTVADFVAVDPRITVEFSVSLQRAIVPA